MLSKRNSETKVRGFSPVAVRGLQCLLASLALLAASAVQAVPLTPPGYLDDDGDSYFVPGDIVLGIELLDAIDPASEFGFFYRSTPGTLIPIFDSGDVGAGQVAGINFGLGEILDIDTPGPFDLFTPVADAIGFYLTIGGALTLYSDPLLNTALGGADLFFAFQNTTNPLQWALFFEGDLGGGSLAPITFNLLNPLVAVAAVPLPPSVFLMGGLIPLLLVFSRRRRKALSQA